LRAVNTQWLSLTSALSGVDPRGAHRDRPGAS
jgi:hypothetical protein